MIAVFGSTGSVGRSTLQVIRENGISVFALCAGSNLDLLIQQVEEFKPLVVSVESERSAGALRERFAGRDIEFLFGRDSLERIVSSDLCEILVSAMTGTVSLSATIKALELGKRVLLANKESLVSAGKLFMEAARKGVLIPIDSEHSGIFQSLRICGSRGCSQIDLDELRVRKLILTASGGAFRDVPRGVLSKITIAQASHHPNWSMGQKITIDSSTMMNKALEFIEARWLFNARLEQIDVLIHPQSIVHSLVEYEDNSVIACLSQPDMRVAIASGLAFPGRIKSGASPLDLTMNSLVFQSLDNNKFPAINLARQALKEDESTKPLILNAANQTAVDLFCRGRITFDQIITLVAKALEDVGGSVSTIDDVPALEEETRSFVHQLIS